MTKDEWYLLHKKDLEDGDFKKYSSGDYAVRNDTLVKMLKGFTFFSVVEVAGAEADLVDRIFNMYPFVEKYYWSDLVNEALEHANNRIKDHRFEATTIDLDMESPPKADLFICTALEHTKRYIEIIEELNPNTLILLSLPGFDSLGHRVYFPQFTDVINAYGKFMDFIKVQIFISERGLIGEFIELTKNILKRIGLLNIFKKMGVFKSGCGRESNYYKWLILARRRGDKNE